MNAERLLAEYERIADAPDAITRLRLFVLDLAVRGKLVPQEPRDEPVATLLERIASGKERLVASEGLRDRASFPAVLEAEEPFKLPEAWRWTRLANVIDFSAGRTPSRNDTSLWNTGDHAWISIADMEDGATLTATKETISQRAKERIFGCEPAPPGTLIMSFKLTIGKIARLGIPAFHNEAIISIRPHLPELDPYLFRFLPQFARQGDTKGAIKGATLNRHSISNILLPLPPLAEQQRIVAKVDELMALCDRLEAARKGREAARDQLAAASLARLNMPDPETLQDDARFALNALPALTTRPDQIKQLRQTILNLAVRGKLVPQDANDEPATAIVQRIKASLGSIKKTPKVASVPDRLATNFEATPYEAPQGWAWLSAEELTAPGQVITYGILKPVWVETGVPTVRVTEMKTGAIDVSVLPKCEPLHAAKFSRTTLSEGDLLISKDGTIGKTAFVPKELSGGNITQHVLRFAITPEVDRRFVKIVIDGPPYQALMAGETKGVALQGVNVGDFRQMLLPIPPLAEQHRIVAKVDELMALCDRLEASLTDTEATRSRLLDTLLAEALAPAKALELEAA